MAANFLFLSSGTPLDKMAARPVAPAPSTTHFSISTNLKMANAMNSSLFICLFENRFK